MALSEKHRSSIYRNLVPVLGEEEAEALMSQFPATERDELVTRSMLLATEGALRAEIATLRADLSDQIGGLRAEMADRFRQQTIWLATFVVAAIGASTTIAAAVG